MSNDRPSSTRHIVEIEVAGARHTATYSVDHGLISVFYAGGTNTAHLGNMPADVLAKQLLIELVREGFQQTH